MPVSRPFFYRSAKSLYRWIQDIVLNNLLNGCEIARLNFDMNLPHFLFGGVAIEFHWTTAAIYFVVMKIFLITFDQPTL